MTDSSKFTVINFLLIKSLTGMDQSPFGVGWCFLADFKGRDLSRETPNLILA